MKYIRTKDRIILDKDKYLQDLDIEQYSMYMQGLLKQADNIEELCDMFICQRMIFRKLKDVKTYLRLANEWCNFNIYGAIWVKLENGAWRLEPVAKMNDEGELERLENE